MNEEERKEYSRRYYIKHRDKIRAKVAQWRKENRERFTGVNNAWRKANLGRVRKSQRAYKQRHSEKIKQYNKVQNARYKKLHAEAIKEYMRRWNATHAPERREYVNQRYREDPEYRRRVIDRVAARRAKNQSVPSDITLERIELLKAAQKYRCAYCDRKRRLTIDHIIPVSKNGVHMMFNIALACRPCNSRKKDRPAPMIPPLMILPF
jgi:5-methylcytosine-specific restriction endonuclease McrA